MKIIRKFRLSRIAPILVLLILGSLIIYQTNFNELGFSVLSGIKKISGKGVNIEKIEKKHSVFIDHSLWTEILKKNVSDGGKVNYKRLKNDGILLAQYVDLLSKNPPGKNWDPEEKIAYWINAYNAFTIKLIVDHYPVESIKDISNGIPMINSPWDIKFFSINGVSLDLNTIEHEILRKEFSEPRIHFAINCASSSCPVLREEAYRGKILDSQLNDQAYRFMLDRKKNIINLERTAISKIFDWFENDFTKEGSLKDFIQKYNNQLDSSNPIEYLKYDWGLNEFHK